VSLLRHFLAPGPRHTLGSGHASAPVTHSWWELTGWHSYRAACLRQTLSRRGVLLLRITRLRSVVLLLAVATGERWDRCPHRSGGSRHEPVVVVKTPRPPDPRNPPTCPPHPTPNRAETRSAGATGGNSRAQGSGVALGQLRQIQKPWWALGAAIYLGVRSGGSFLVKAFG
jgi:hypothetical protein